MKNADWSVVTAALAVAAAAFLGGAFHAGPRIAIGLVLAVAAVGMVAGLNRALAPEEGVGLAFLGWAATASLVVGNNPLAAREVVTTWLVALIAWGAARRISGDGARCAGRVLVVSAVVVALGIAAEVWGMGRIRAGGFLENPNVAASLLVVSLPIVFLPGVVDRRGVRWIAAGVMIAGVALSGSRAGLLAALAVGAVMQERRRGRLVALFAGGAGAMGVLAWRLLSQPDILAWFRPSIWLAVLRLWANHPVVGVGPGGLVNAAGPVRILHPDHVGQRQFLVAYAESTPLAILVQTGIVGLILVVMMAGIWIAGTRRAGLLGAAPLRGVLAAMICVAAFHDLLTAGVVLWWWALALGLAEAAHGRHLGVDDPAPGRARIEQSAIALIAAYVVLWGMVQPSLARFVWRDSKSEPQVLQQALRAEPWYPEPSEWRVRSLLAEEDWNWRTAAEALAHAERSVTVEPGSASAWGGLALVHSRVVLEFGPWPDSVSGARTAFERATELEPHQPWHWLEWARFERGLGEARSASALAHRATEAEPNAVRAWLLLARIEVDRGEVEQGRRAFEHAVEASKLAGGEGLNRYERELVTAPEWQIRELEEALR